jgi:hypothetical protein
MHVADELGVIAEQAHRELDAVHDFYEQSKSVWQSFKVFVDQGNSVISQNVATGTIANQGELVALAPRYIREYLATFTFRHFVSTFEAFLFNFLHHLLRHNPWQFAKSRLEFEGVLRAADRDEIISGVITEQLNKLKYDNLREWFVALEKAVTLDCPSADEIEALAEVKAARDILEHNAGLVNEIYLRKSGRKARYAAGDHVEIDDPYHLLSWRLIKKVVSDVSTATVAKFAGA